MIIEPRCFLDIYDFFKRINGIIIVARGEWIDRDLDFFVMMPYRGLSNLVKHVLKMHDLEDCSAEEL